jgi:hypothetical protein
MTNLGIIMSLHLRFTGYAFLASCALAIAGCSDDDRIEISTSSLEPNNSAVAGSGNSGAGGASSVDNGSGGAVDLGNGADGYIVVVTERESPETNLQYLHLLEGWPSSRVLDYESAVELGEFVSVHAMGNAVYVHQPDDATVRKLVVGPDGSIDGDQVVSFATYGVTGPSGDMVYVSPSRAYFIDEAAERIVTWDPDQMEVLGSAAIAEDALIRNGLAAQVSRGIALQGQGFVASSWRDWDTLAYHDAAAIGIFDATATEPELRIVEDTRCASTVTTPFDGGDGFVYLISDAALGFDALANPTRTEKALCVLRMRPGTGEFDASFFVDLKDTLQSPGFFAAHPMKDGRLLVNVWAPDVELDSVATPNDSSWYWDLPPYFEYAIVDLVQGTSTPVPALERAAVQWSITLRVDGDTYVQTYRDDTGSDLHRVNPNGTVVNVLSNGAGTDVQYLGRVRE